MQSSEFPPHPRSSRDGQAAMPALSYAGPLEYASEDLRAIEVLDYWRVIIQRRRLILVCGVAGALLGFLALIPQPFQFKSRTRVELHPSKMSIVGLGQVDNDNEAGPSTDASVATELEILNSDTLRARVTETLRREMPSTSIPQFSDWLGRLRTKAQVMLHRTPRDPLLAMNEALRTCTKSLSVKPSKGTRIVEISCESTSPDVAASFVNSLASAYIDQGLEQRLKGIQRMSEWFSSQVLEAKGRMEKTEEKLNAISRAGGNLGGQDDSQVDPLLQAKVAQLQRELTSVQAERIDKQMRYQMAVAKSSNAEVLDPGLIAANLHLGQLKREMQELSAAYTPAYSKVKALQTQISDLETQIAKQQDAMIERAKVELEAVQKKESLLSSTYQTQLRGVVSAATSSKAMDYALLKRQLATDRQIYDIMLHQFNQAGLASVLPMESVRVIDPGVPNRNPSNREEWLYSGMGMAAGCLTGFMLGVVLRYLDRSFMAPGQVSTVLNLPELGAIPSGEFMRSGRGIGNRKDAALLNDNSGGDMEMVVWREKPSLIAESFRLAVTSILQNRNGSSRGRRQLIVVTSAHIREGKSTITSNLAITLAELGQRVLVIDADLRRPRQQDIFGISTDQSAATLSGILMGPAVSAALSSGKLGLPTEVPNLWLLPAGKGVENVNAALSTSRFHEVLSRAKGEFDIILMDTPPVMNFSDARVLARAGDGVILVVRAGVTDRDSAIAASKRLHEDGAAVIGTILNDWTPSGSHAKQYRSYEHYYRS
jgi:polysaccharide biosynthesis transport protein